MLLQTYNPVWFRVVQFVRVNEEGDWEKKKESWHDTRSSALERTRPDTKTCCYAIIEERKPLFTKE